MSDNRKTFCIHPFTSIAPKSFDSDGNLKTFWPCCMMGNDIHVDSNLLEISEDVANMTPLEMFHHPRMDELRNNLANGIRDKACKVCWDMEDKGIRSFRQDAEVSETEEIALIENPKLEVIDTHVNNACNLRCRMCDPSASSQFKKDTNYFRNNKLLPKVRVATDGRWAFQNVGWKMDDVSQWRWIHENTDKFSVLKLAGGEPFYNPHVLKFLKKAIDEGNSQNIQLEFHTNGTLFDDELCEILQQFKTNLNLSIDGHGSVYEYVRYPMSWKQLDESVRRYIKACNSRHIHISFIPMIYNIFNVTDFINWCNDLPTEVIVHWAEVYPFDRGVALKHLSPLILQNAKDKISKLNFDTDKLINIIDDAINRNEENKEKALLEISLFDRSRNQTYKDYLPFDIIQWLKDIDNR